jgi:membrane-associated PAP2 superfamily phosphatase
MSDPVKFPKRQAWKDFSILILVLGLLTLLFRYTRLDIRLEQYFYSPEKGWALQYRPFWDFIYRFGIFPGYIMAFCGLIMISVSYWNPKYIKFRKASLVLVFTIIVGPGIIANLVLKDHAGRPRPREITEFGGTDKFLCVCELGKNTEGKSFPCGHCTMGFYLAIPWLFYRNRKKILAWSFLLTGISYGLLIGIARMMAGGHFASDVIWAGGITWAVALAGYYIFRLDKPVAVPSLSESERKKRAKYITIIIGILLPVITIGLMLATPYISKKYIDITRDQLKSAHCRTIELDLKDAVVSVSNSKTFHLDYKVNAFGFPNSKIRGLWTPGDTGRYIIQYMGWFTEVRNVIDIKLPETDSISWFINVNHGKVICNLNDNCKTDLHISLTKGDILIHPASDSLSIIGNPANIVSKTSRKPRYSSTKASDMKGTLITFEVKDGAVIIE